MNVTIQDAASAIFDQNKDALKRNAKRRAGQMFNDRLTNLIKPKLPMMARGYADEPWFKFALINAFAVASVKFGSTSSRLMTVTEAAVEAANDEFLGSFNLEEMIDNLLEGIPLLEATEPEREVENV